MLLARLGARFTTATDKDPSMRTRTLLATAAGLATVAATALPAAAIKYGQPDDGAHPYVGMMIAYVSADVDGDGDEELVAGWRCTGTQLDVDTFLTAGHCTYGAEAVAIWYDDDIDHLTGADFRLFDDAMVNADAYSFKAVTHPEYDDAAFYLHDAGIVDQIVLNEGTAFDQYGTLPELGYWDGQLATRKKDRDSYVTVGYGLQWSMPSRGKSEPSDNNNARQDEGLWIKLRAGGELVNNRQFDAGKGQDSYVVLSSNAHTGGTCSGDSGGPTFVEGTSTVVAVTSFGMNETCAGSSGVYRIDTADDLAWIGGYVG